MHESEVDCLIAPRADFPEMWVEYEGEEYYKHDGWYAYRGSPYSLPRSIFRILVRNVKCGDQCPSCGEGRLDDYEVDDNFSWLFCDVCGEMDNDDWWSELRLKIRWKGSGEKRSA